MKRPEVGREEALTRLGLRPNKYRLIQWASLLNSWAVAICRYIDDGAPVFEIRAVHLETDWWTAYYPIEAQDCLGWCYSYLDEWLVEQERYHAQMSDF